MGWVSGVGLTRFGEIAGSSTLSLMSEAADLALLDASLTRDQIDGLITGYSTVFPHIMLSSVFAEHFGLRPSYAHSIQLGGATGLAMIMLASTLVDAGVVRNVLVVAGENRATGQSRDTSMSSLSQVGHAGLEVPFGASIPAYYGLMANRYMMEHQVTEEDLAYLAVLMRENAGRHAGAHFRKPINVGDVLNSRIIASPLKLLDCCPISDGGAAVVISAAKPAGLPAARIIGAGQAHLFQHISEAPFMSGCGARISTGRAFESANVILSDISHAAIYDSFTITLLMLLEEIGFAPRGNAGRLVKAGAFGIDGALPLNTHGGLLSYGHCGVSGSMAHFVETQLQATGRAGERQIRNPALALVHADGGVLSSHVSLVIEQVS